MLNHCNQYMLIYFHASQNAFVTLKCHSNGSESKRLVAKKLIFWTQTGLENYIPYMLLNADRTAMT